MNPLKRCLLALVVAPLLALPARAEDITLTVDADTSAGTLSVKLKAQGLALGSAAAGTPPVSPATGPRARTGARA